MAFDEAEVRILARLAHLALSDAEIRETAGHFERLLGYIAQIQAIDVTGVSETVHACDATTPLRPDIARPGLPREVMTAAAPAAAAGLFEVPRVVVRTPSVAIGDVPDETADEIAP